MQAGVALGSAPWTVSHTNTYICTYTHMHTRTHSLIHAHTHTYAHTYTYQPQHTHYPFAHSPCISRYPHPNSNAPRFRCICVCMCECVYVCVSVGFTTPFAPNRTGLGWSAIQQFGVREGLSLCVWFSALASLASPTYNKYISTNIHVHMHLTLLLCAPPPSHTQCYYPRWIATHIHTQHSHSGVPRFGPHHTHRPHQANG